MLCMSFISTLARLYKNLKDALRYSHFICKYAARVNAELQASNASDSLKTQGAAVLTAANALCAAIEAYKNSLPGEAGP